MGGLVISLVAVNAILAQNAFVIEDLAQQVQDLERRHERSQLEVARLRSPARIAEQARRLGMQLPPPRDVEVVHVGLPRAGGSDPGRQGGAPHAEPRRGASGGGEGR